MNRWKRKPAGFVAVVIILMAAVMNVMRVGNSPEPEHEGRPLRAWLEDLDGGYGIPKYHAAQAAIRFMGTNALPFLIRYLRYKDRVFHHERILLKAKLGLLHGKVDYAFLWHRRAATACGELGIDAAPAFPAMAEAMNDQRAAEYVGDALTRMLPGSASTLTNILATGNAVARCQAARALTMAWAHPSIEEMSRTALLRALRDPHQTVRMIAQSALSWKTNVNLVAAGVIDVSNDRDGAVSPERGHGPGPFTNANRTNGGRR